LDQSQTLTEPCQQCPPPKLENSPLEEHLEPTEQPQKRLRDSLAATAQSDTNGQASTAQSDTNGQASTAQSDTNGQASTAQSDQMPQEVGKVGGKLPWLTTISACMESELDVSTESDDVGWGLLTTQCDVPSNTLLGYDILRGSIAELQDKNKTRVVQDLARLFVPSVRTLARISHKRFDVFVESVGERWDANLLDTQSQPDYAMGLGRIALSDQRIKKLHSILQNDPSSSRSIFNPTQNMWFPILTSEVECAEQGIDIAQTRNATNMGVAVQMIVTLFHLAGCKNDLHNELVAFSASHDHQNLILTGWGPRINGNRFTVHPFPIRSFDITDPNETWTAYKFTVGVYEHALPLLTRINNAIDKLPYNLNLESITPLTMGFGQDSESEAVDGS
jgi:hypothetical protein